MRASRYPLITWCASQGTEAIHSGEYNQHFERGEYACAGCYKPLYSSDHKFSSEHGWPAFSEALPEALQRHGTRKVEITCAGCAGHIGHIFKSSRYPPPHYERHCVNSVSLVFVPEYFSPPRSPATSPKHGGSEL